MGDDNAIVYALVVFLGVLGFAACYQMYVCRRRARAQREQLRREAELDAITIATAADVAAAANAPPASAAASTADTSGDQSKGNAASNEVAPHSPLLTSADTVHVAARKMSAAATGSVAVAASPERVLTLGDGNFSFSLAFAKKYPTALLTATSFDSRDELLTKYRESGAILQSLAALAPRVRVLHNVNACDIRSAIACAREVTSVAGSASAAPAPSAVDVKQPQVASAANAADPVFDSIYFNHPHTGVENTNRHRALLAHFFFSAKPFLAPSGSIYVSLCNDQPERWQMTEQASKAGLICARIFPFAELCFVGYTNRRHHTDRAFPIQNSRTFVYARPNSLPVAAAVGTSDTSVTASTARAATSITPSAAATAPAAITGSAGSSAASESAVLDERRKRRRDEKKKSRERKQKQKHSTPEPQSTPAAATVTAAAPDAATATPTIALAAIPVAALSEKEQKKERRRLKLLERTDAALAFTMNVRPTECPVCRATTKGERGLTAHAIDVHKFDATRITALIAEYKRKTESAAATPVAIAADAKSHTAAAPPSASAAAPAPAAASFVCDSCGRGFGDAIALSQHVTYKHSAAMIAVAQQTAIEKAAARATPSPAAATPSASAAAAGSGSFTCPVCLIAFDTANALAEHESDLKPIDALDRSRYACAECDRTFANLKAQTQHMALAHPNKLATTTATSTATTTAASAAAN